MHELTLFGQVSSAYHEQMLAILAGVAGMDPEPVLERHLIYKPKQAPVRQKVQVGGSQEVVDAQKARRQAEKSASEDVYYLKLIESIAVDPEREMDAANSRANSQPLEATTTRWRTRFEDLPLPGNQQVTSRATVTTDVNEVDAVSYMEAKDYQLAGQYIVQGHTFVYSNIVLLLHRVLRISQDIAFDARSSLPALSELKPYDSSDSYVMTATIRVSDGSNIALLQRGTAELVKFREMMKGAVDVRPASRLSLDTRVRM